MLTRYIRNCVRNHHSTIDLNRIGTFGNKVEGSYAMTSRTERLSDLIRKAGGSTKNAYLRGAKLTRVATEGEKKRMEDVLRLMSRQLGEAMMDSLDA